MIHRRSLLGGLGLSALAPAAATSPPLRSATAPRKVIIGTALQAFWVPYPGLQRRLDELTGIVGRMASESLRRYGRGLDLAILPETSVTGEAGPNAWERSVPFAGAVAEAFGRAARLHHCYIVVPTYLREAGDSGRCSNAAILVDRAGREAGTYRKVHLVVAADGRTMEGGAAAGNSYPVFDCDFGKLGLQICYDMEFDAGWRALTAHGADIVAWPTQSPQTAQPAARAAAGRCYIISSTWRHNASIFEPTGKITAQIRPPQQVLVEEIDLSYAILPWSSKLANGKAMQRKYGDRAGFRYYEDEDLGIFWSNDPKTPVREMIQSLGLLEADEELARVRESYRRAGVPE